MPILSPRTLSLYKQFAKGCCLHSTELPWFHHQDDERQNLKTFASLLKYNYYLLDVAHNQALIKTYGPNVYLMHPFASFMQNELEIASGTLWSNPKRLAFFAEQARKHGAV